MLPENWDKWCREAKLKPYSSKKPGCWMYLKGRGYVWRVNSHNMFQCGDKIKNFERWALCEIEEVPLPENYKDFIAAIEYLLKTKLC